MDRSGTEQAFAARAMMRRIGEPEDISNAVVFLARVSADGGRRGDGLHRTRLDQALRTLVLKQD